MVLLTMTPAMVDAIHEYRSLAESGPSARSTGLADEPPLDDAAVGKPISHGQIVDISKILLEHESSLQYSQRDDGGLNGAKNFHLDHLLHGSTLYVPPAKPKPEPTDEYKALMEKLRFEEENRAYERMLQPASPDVGQKPSPFPALSSSASTSDDEITYADVNRQLALIINILISIVACSCAIWMASSHWSTPRRLGLSLAGSGLVGVAEVVVYAGYLRRLTAAKARSRKRKETKMITKTWVVGGEKTD